MAYLIEGVSRVPMRPLPPPPPPPSAAPVAAVRPAARSLPPPVARSKAEVRDTTAQRTAELEEASARLAELQAGRRAAPGGLRYEYEQMITDARRTVADRQAALTESVAAQVRQAAQTTPPDVANDLYRSHAAVLTQADVAPASRDAYVAAVDAGVAQARESEPANVYEAQWQRNAQIWEAEAAQYELEQKLADEPVVIGAEGMVDPALEAERIDVELQWQDVREAFATEYEVVRLTPRSQLPAGFDPLAAHRADIAAERFDERYRDRILDAASSGVAQLDIEAAIDARVDAEAKIVEDALASGGTAAAFDALVSAKDALSNLPVAVNGEPSDDPIVLALAQQRLDDRLRPVQQQIAAGAAADLQARANVPAQTTRARYDVALDVSGRLALYTATLPADLVPGVVEQSRPAWAPQIAFLGEQAQAADSSHPQVRGSRRPYDPPGLDASDAFGGIVGHFMDVGEALADAPGGDAALDAMAGEFAGAVDPQDIGAFDEAFGRQGVGIGHGLHLAVQTVNHLAADDSTRDRANDLLEGLRDGHERWTETARATLQSFAENRDALNHYIESFPGGIRALTGCDLRDVDDPTVMELSDAIHDYLARHPDVAEKDAELLNQISVDGVHLLHAELAWQGLSPEALALDEAGEALEPLQEFLAPEEGSDGPALWEIYAGTPGVQNEMARFAASSAQAYQQLAGASSAAEEPRGVLQTISAAQSPTSIARNTRFMVMELVHPKTGVPAVRTSVLSESRLVQVSGVLFFGAAAGSAFLDASGAGDPGLDGWDRVVAGIKGANYTFIGTRDAVGLVEMVSHRSSLQSLFRATGPEAKAYLGSHIQLAKGLQLTSRGLFVGTDLYTLVGDVQDGRNGGVIAGDTLSLVGSGFMLAEAGMLAGVGPFAAVSSWAGPVAWIGTGLWTAGAVVKYQFSRVEQSNRYETADQRRFLSHFGSRDENGQLRPVTPDTEVSNAADHDPDIRLVSEGAPRGDDIVYRGLSADAVDELMNYSGSAGNPVSGIPGLDALAASRGIDERSLYLQWYSNPSHDGIAGLSHDQRKALSVAAQGVRSIDGAGGGIDGENLSNAWLREWTAMNDSFATWDPERVPDDDRWALQDYVVEHEVVSYESDPAGQAPVMKVDESRLRLLLRLREPQAGETAPPPGVTAAAEHVLADTAQHGRDELNDGGFRPRTPDELAYWMSLHGYPALPSAQVACDIGERPVPQPMVEPAPPEPEPTPVEVDHRYIVQPGDNLWDIAGATITPTDLQQLVEYHNGHNPAGEPDFDLARADADFFTPHEAGDRRRDPDLIHPGEVIYVVDVADIRKA